MLKSLEAQSGFEPLNKGLQIAQGAIQQLPQQQIRLRVVGPVSNHFATLSGERNIMSFVFPLSPKLIVTILGDAGGWGAGSQLDYDIVGAIGYKLTPSSYWGPVIAISTWTITPETSSIK
ncbi:MAG: hypothetical protein JOY54_19225 [Acidobacteriaceae bacterium]|nr:hypothetical protein [Acidobacteriaceae bacterium]